MKRRGSLGTPEFPTAVTHLLGGISCTGTIWCRRQASSNKLRRISHSETACRRSEPICFSISTTIRIILISLRLVPFRLVSFR